jgi:Ribosomal protein L11 methyltransferase (PrmA)
MFRVIISISFIFFVCALSLMGAKSPFARCSAARVSGFGGMRSSHTSTAHDDVGISKDSRTILLSNKACRTRIGPFEIIAEECDSDISLVNLKDVVPTPDNVIRLMDVGSGWGNGAHPTTKLCLNFVLKSITKGDKVLDYGTGSGILSIAAAKLGASHCVAVDIDEDTLIAAEINGRVNGVSDVIDVVHTRSVYVGEDRFPVSDVTVANILPVSH